MVNRTKTLLVALIVAALTLVMSASTAFAEDVVRLKNGTEYRGTIVSERGGAIFIEVTYGTMTRTEVIVASDVDEIIRDAVSNDADEAGDDEPQIGRTEAPAERRPGVPRAAVISLEGTVGQLLTAESLQDILPMLEEDDIDIVVFRINSPGGLTIEVDRLSDVIHEHYKPRFRVVSWIKSAISAASMTSHNIEEIYFRPEGSYGGSTQFNGGTGVASTGRSLEEILYRAEGWSERGGYPIEIMRSMQIDVGLSADLNESTGEITFYNSDEGEHLICRPGEILTFTAPVAERWGFSRGTAATLDELQQMMRLPEVDWVGEWRSGFDYPISRSEDFMLEFRDDMERDFNAAGMYLGRYQQFVQAAQGQQDRRLRNIEVSAARRELAKLWRASNQNKNIPLFILNAIEERQWRDWFQDQHDLLDEISRG